MSSLSVPKWKERLRLEIAAQAPLLCLSSGQLADLVRSKRMTSDNHDTVVSLNWPHYCSGATSACGGQSGWCYTFQGHQALSNHHPKVALTDLAAKTIPDVFAEKVAKEIKDLTNKGKLPYPNLRFSGSGETATTHLPALYNLIRHGIHLWGFTRNHKNAAGLKNAGASVIFSCDRTTKPKDLELARSSGLAIAYSSDSVSDRPPTGTIVTFPLHRSGAVKEVTDSPTVCPKVMEEFCFGDRDSGACQWRCNRCHLNKNSKL
jgi:hypothetical protein